MVAVLRISRHGVILLTICSTNCSGERPPSQIASTYDFLSATLPLDISSPPVSPFPSQLVPIHADLPAVFTPHALPAHGDGDDLVSETDPHELDVAGVGGRPDVPDKLDQRGDKRVGKVVRGVFCQ